MSDWAWGIVALTAVLCLGGMSVVVARMLGRKAASSADGRTSTPAEAGLYGATVDDPTARVFDGWAYRVPARFAGRVRVVVTDDRVSVTGPRVSAALYGAWIWAQALLFAAVAPVLAWALLAWRWQLLAVALGVFLLSYLVQIIGAASLPSIGELTLMDNGEFTAVEFARADAIDVAIGKGWARGGMEIVLLPFVKGVDMMSRNRCVSWFAPDERGREVRYAVHVYSDRTAEELAALLER